jgi:hypothetical protein
MNFPANQKRKKNVTALILLLWLGAAVFVAQIAQMNNRQARAWFVLALVFTPLMAILGLCAVGKGTQPT